MQALMERPTETTQFEKVATQTARYEDGSVSISVKRALDELDQLDAVQGVRFGEAPDSFLVGELEPSSIDGRTDPMGRTLKDPGEDVRVMIPPAAYDHLGIDVDEVRESEVRLDVWVVADPDVDGKVIAISPHMRETFGLKWRPDGDSE